MDNGIVNKMRMDNLLVVVHISYVIVMFLIVGFTPFYISVFFMAAQHIQDKIVGDCILTKFQREYGFAEENEDCFHYLFRKLHIEINSKITRSFYHIIRLIIFIVFLFKVYSFYK